MERRLIQERTQAGLNAARARGKVGGRKPVTNTDSKVITAKRMHNDKTLTINDICDVLKISRSTLYRYLSLDNETRPAQPIGLITEEAAR